MASLVLFSHVTVQQITTCFEVVFVFPMISPLETWISQPLEFIGKKKCKLLYEVRL